VKKWRIVFLVIACLIGLAGYNQINPFVVKTYYSVDDTHAPFNENEFSVLVRYYQMSNGTWRTDNYTYKYRLIITGRPRAAKRDCSFVFLSNTKDITFEQAWKASGMSSSLSDYFDEEIAVFVAMK